MEQIRSRKNQYILHLRALGKSGDARREVGEYVCDGEKLLREALQFGAEVTSVLWRDTAAFPLPDKVAQYTADAELVEYASPLMHSPGPVFTVRIPEMCLRERLRHVIVLEGVQDPGNVGTVIRTANALGMDAVVLTGACADLYSPKTVRATMGALFRQAVLMCTMDELTHLLHTHGLKLYGAALTDTAQDLRRVPLSPAAVAIGSEGRGLSAQLLAQCDGQIIIPMQPGAESLNAAVAAAVVMWEIARAGM
ncbi:MAG: TrmH family RNA methyltransferase [Oscillospiraceae bacterium]